ncbi:5-amino-6-(5-phosphoribosylamino)uracil reductase [Sulfuricella denitrificans skB26]|uniref:Riboflavin biosynthesis protein RibD n=1 Tax=Sulfuricella denitrificans (strain DSM 22764 / NBRC 105220 / skB26) TaxID=1163617 RepID=S6A9T7_SULDS|nr:bifunctional diaminohydroxyphosphoribosylaminopyrimidine deaminase/5-amino-6-(5-phosphoribosylamino)uracil reductase RibD [Sulfuricella denitrificans]BAN34680.1 5-amino-6-(5-phosphoribosylamino)uracil reductase [Sulfuricella denitrificans skB26]
MFSSIDYEYMAQALRLAEKGLYTTTPNPRVGCVIVRDGKVVGSGWHARAGEPHAEINALMQAGDLAQGATVYVTLEPCSHHGRTPPCAGALIQAGVGRVVVAMVDPNPQVEGEGITQLQQAGIQTDIGLLEKEAHDLNIGFVSRMTSGRPWLRLKIAASLDGKTALNNGVSQWITGADARRDAHRLRARSCAVLTGIGTVLADDPMLNVREVETPRQPLRVVVDSTLKMPPSAKMLLEEEILVVTASGDHGKAENLRKAGAEVLVLPPLDGRVDLARMLDELGKRGINEITVEAGRGLNGALVRLGLVDEFVIYFAPLLLGDRARGMFDLPELVEMGERRELRIADVGMVGRDVRIRALPVE